MNTTRYIQELRDELNKLGPVWNLTGSIDRMKVILNQIERETITINYTYKKNK